MERKAAEPPTFQRPAVFIATEKLEYKAESTLYLRESVLIKRSLAKVLRVIFLNCACSKPALF